jgi:uncharacterized protein (TIGR00369 family)
MTTTFTPANPDYESVVRESFARQGLMTTLGARIVDLGPGFCVIEMPFTPAVSQQQGFFHGGAVGAIADTATGYATYTLMPAGAEILTVEYKLNLVRAALPPLLRAEGRVLRAGRTLTVCRADVFHRDGEPCALMQSTMMRVEPAQQRAE